MVKLASFLLSTILSFGAPVHSQQSRSSSYVLRFQNHNVDKSKVESFNRLIPEKYHKGMRVKQLVDSGGTKYFTQLIIPNSKLSIEDLEMRVCREEMRNAAPCKVYKQSFLRDERELKSAYINFWKTYADGNIEELTKLFSTRGIANGGVMKGKKLVYAALLPAKKDLAYKRLGRRVFDEDLEKLFGKKSFLWKVNINNLLKKDGLTVIIPRDYDDLIKKYGSKNVKPRVWSSEERKRYPNATFYDSYFVYSNIPLKNVKDWENVGSLVSFIHENGKWGVSGLAIPSLLNPTGRFR